MKQLTQKLGSGEMLVQDFPIPQLNKGMILVKNHYSIISAGTELSTVQAARKKLIGKVKEQPQQVKQVFSSLKSQGSIQTYRSVMKKLDSYSPLGYSCAGEVLEVGQGVRGYIKGDLVACAGIGYANHAEVVSVPKILCVKLPSTANLRDAAYNTLGAISLQGVRQADLRLGECCAVIGLGLLGQIACKMLKASGVRVIGIDISEESIVLGTLNGAVDKGFIRTTPGIKEKIKEFSYGMGVDAIIIAAATASHDPINFSGAIARKKGKVVVLGAVPTGFDRDPYWYKKELELKMLCSYGPGRYDINYEEKGIDYPAAYVRWTENRNMEAFQNLLHSGAIKIDYLTTHEFKFENALEAYNLLVNKTEPFFGISLKYDVSKNHQKQKIRINTCPNKSDLKISFIGAGSYAQGNLLPFIPSNEKIQRVGILTNSGTTSKRVAEKFSFEFCTANENDVLDNNSNMIFITTRHDSHATYILKGLKNNKYIFVEKPLCLSFKELDQIKQAMKNHDRFLMVGYNRRFSSLTKLIKSNLDNVPMSMIYRINAGSIQKDSWIQDMEMGGGRIIGEVCHFIDYLTFLNGSLPLNVSALALPDQNNLNDTVNILIKFENGSTGVIAYYSNGSKGLPKEYVEIFSAGSIAVLNDFKELKIYGGSSVKKKKLFNQDKGQKQMVKIIFDDYFNKGLTPIPFEELYATTKTSFLVLESIRKGGIQISL